MTMTIFDALETRDPELRASAICSTRLRAAGRAREGERARLRRASCRTSIRARSTSRAALARLPVTRKSDLQGAAGRRAARSAASTRRRSGSSAKIFVSPGPDLRAGGPRRATGGALARALYAAGFRRRRSRRTTASPITSRPAGSMLENGRARAAAARSFPAGVGQTEMQVATIAELGVGGYVGTPSFLKLILEKADELKRRHLVPQEGAGRRGVRCRRRCATRWPSAASSVMQSYATADLGLIAYETRGPTAGVRGHGRRRGRPRSRSCGPAPATRCPRARSAKWSSRASTPTIR